MNPTIQKMQQDLVAFRQKKMGGGEVPTTEAPAPISTPAPAEAPSVSPIAQDLESYRQEKATGTAKKTAPKEGGNALVNFAKGIFSAPITLAARPFQAVAEGARYVSDRPQIQNYEAELSKIREDNNLISEQLKQARASGQDTSELVKRAYANSERLAQLNDANEGALDNSVVDRATASIPGIGGFIAPTPKNAGDVMKDVGRGAQTIALGIGSAPIAAGALFGAGSSLEQGNDLFSVQTAFDAALGGAGGKVLEFLGKPIINAAGKVIGKYTPEFLQNLAKGGTKAIQEFAAAHELPVIGSVTKPLSESIVKGAQGFDSAIENGVSKAVKGTGTFLREQFPNVKTPTEHYQAKNVSDIVRPTTVNEPKYSKATRVFEDAKGKGIDLGEVAKERGIIHDQLAEGGKYNTTDVVDNLKQANYEVSDRIARPAIAAAEGGVERVPVSEVRAKMLKQVNDIPSTQITPDDRAKMLSSINRRYAANGPVSSEFPEGMTLTNLHDSRIISAKNGGYKPGGSTSDALKAQLSREEGRVYSSIFDNKIPEEVGMKPFRKELEKNFLLADYLDELHQKKVPAGITKKAVRLFGRAVAATAGGKIGGFPGSILGSQYGDMLFSSFEALPNPIKMHVLQSVKVEDPKIFQELVNYIGKEKAAQLTRLQLPAAGQSSYKEPNPTYYVTPGGKASPVMGEATDIAAVESGAAKRPTTDRRLKSYRNKGELERGLGEFYTPDKDLPTIKAGRKPKSKKSLNDILID